MLCYEIRSSAVIPNYPMGRGRRIRIKYPFGKMSVGTCFVVPNHHPGADYCPGTPGQTKAYAAAKEYGRRHGWEFNADRQTDGSVRVERIA